MFANALESTQNLYLPEEAEIVERTQDSRTIFTWRLRFTDPARQAAYRFQPGQFNMIYLHGVGEVPISIVSDIAETDYFDHTIRAVGRVTHALARLKPGDRIGIRGPFGRGWPMHAAQRHDVLIMTGGLGCAPVVSVIEHVLRRRERYGRLTILQGVKHSEDLIWRERYERWMQVPNTRVALAADIASPGWKWHVGLVTQLLDQADIDHARTMTMICGPEPMMRATAEQLVARGMSADHLWLSMERNMQCAVGHCGHCQFGPHFVCRDGPVFPYIEIKSLLGVKGF
ncbi:MAG: FAD/NAD(P)-binding protein [Thiotrichales bacterium]